MINSTPNDVFGGVEQWMVRTALGLEERGHSVGICARPQGLFARRCTAVGLTLVAGAGGSDFDPRRSLALARAARKRRATLAIVNFNKDLIHAARARARSPLQFLVMRSVLPMLDTSDRHRRLYARCLDGIITPSRGVRRTIEEYPWMRTVRVENIPNGIDLGRIERARTRYGGRAPARTELGFSPDHFVIGGVGRLERHKGFEHLLEAAHLLSRHHRRVGLVLAGAGSLEAELRARADRMTGTDLQVIFTGHLDDPDTVLPAFDVLVLPSTTGYETFGQVLIEAMAFHVPVIGSQIGGIPEIIRHEQNGLLCEPGAAGALEAALTRLVSDPDLRRSLARAGRRTVEEHYREATMVDRVETWLGEFVS